MILYVPRNQNTKINYPKNGMKIIVNRRKYENIVMLITRLHSFYVTFR